MDEPLMTRTSKDENVFEHPLAVLALGARPHNALIRSGIRTVEHLLSLNEERILQIRNIGQGSLAEIRAKLAAWQPDTCLAPSVQLALPLPPREPRWIEDEDLPPFLLHDETSLAALRLESRSRNCILAHGIRSVAELCALSQRELRNLRGLGERAWEDIRRQVTLYAKAGPPPPPPPQLIKPVPQPPSVQELITRWLDQLDERTREMVCFRYGLGCERLTMQQIADRWGITRSRVEQIVNHKVLRHLQKIGGATLARYLQMLRDYVAQKGGLVSEAELHHELGECMDLGGADPVLACQILAAADDGLDWMGGLRVLRDETLSSPIILAVRQEARRLLAEIGGEASLSRLLLLLRHSYVGIEQGGALSDSALFACLRTDASFEIADDTIRCGRRLPDLIERILVALREIGAPAHFTEIAAQVNTALPAYEPAADHNIHAAMQRRRDLFTRVGRGRYGLVEWGLPTDGCVADAIARILAEESAPLTIAEITERVLQTWQVNPGTVQAALGQDPRFVSAGKGVYKLA